MGGTRWILVFLIGQMSICLEAAAALPARNPLDASIPKFDWSMELQDVVSIPNSNNQAPRLEFLTGGGAPGLAYVLDQRGKIYSFDTGAGSPTPVTFLDLTTAVPAFRDGFQQGLRGLAFHPDFNNSGTDGYRKFYTSHSRTAFGGPLVGNPVIFGAPSPPGVDHDSIVGEWTVNANGTVDTSSYRELLYVGQTNSDHNIAQIGFNPNASSGEPDFGKLYIALGDGGGPQDPFNLAQNLSQPLGSYLRIDPLAAGANPFSVPGDNPFRTSNDPATARNLIWANGLRNAHRFTFDTAGDGKMLITDIGQGSIEEINLGVAGANYGWDLREGTFLTTGNPNEVDNLPANHTTDGFTYPVAQYDHINNLVNGSVAIVGGSVYRGTQVPQLTGLYLFGEFATNSGPIFAVDVDELFQRDDFTNLTNLNNGHLAPFAEVQLTSGGVEKTLLQIIADETGQNESRTDLRFGVGPDGEIYVLNKHDGVVRKIVSVSGILDGDADRDGDVDGRDFLTWQRNFGKSGDWSDGDFNASGMVDQADLALWQAEYGNSAALASSRSVPEPTIISSCLIALMVASLSRKLLV
ncbi:PQQ-dependent sugar dehydrogenase [Bythopirellula goksoeyrii]|uniref:Glucose / Sorbosone dehydrogenase n=1 Tax=Bythopirellula goksoeyrii TaxID=1400387 RepID=A0A5B9QLW3_9BACT|nr:PQQ-dependent sugar dehydrogenase [Bythopirellula goksoeyrii]QEG37986.1 Glucose / Sorbosone dehydrogenase [Bythopirellula goksoeyrii]